MGLIVKIGADISQFERDMKKATKDISYVGDKFASVGSSMTAKVTAPIVGVGTAAVATGMNFDKAMSNVQAVSGATGDDFTKLRDLAKDMGSTTQFSASEAAEALGYMGMAGWKTEDMIAGLPGVLNLAAAGGTDLAVASDIVTDAMTALGMSADKTGDFVDVMSATITNSNTNVEMMGETLKYVGPVAGTLGINMEDLSLAIGLMANAGIKGSQSGTALRSGLTNLVKPTDQMQAAMDKYGVAIVKNSEGQVDMMGTINLLREKLGGLDETTQANALATIFGKEAMSGWAAVVNASETDFNKLSGAISDSSGKAGEMATTMNDNLWGAMKSLLSALEGLAIEFSDVLAPAIRAVTEKVTEVVRWFAGLDDGTKKVIVVFALLVASIGPILLMVAGMIKMFKTAIMIKGALAVASGVLSTAIAGISLPVLAVVGVIAGLIAIGVALYKNWDTVKEKATEIWNKITEVCSVAWEGIKNAVQVGIMFVVELIKGAFTLITLPFQLIWQNCKDFLIPIWEQMKQKVSEGINWIKEKITNIGNNIKAFWSGLWNGIKTFLSPIWQGIKGLVSEGMNFIKGIISNVGGGISSFFSGMWNGLKNSAKSGIDFIKNTVKNGLDMVKGFFDKLKLKFPKIKLPHFKINGEFSLAPPSVPKLGVDWYSSGGIFTKPTVFGGVGVGDAINGRGNGPEAVLPIKKLPELLGLDKQSSMPSEITTVVNLDGREIARATSGYMDTALRKNRDSRSRANGGR